MAPKTAVGSQLNLEFGGGQTSPTKTASRPALACVNCRTAIEVPEWFLLKELSLVFCGSKCRRAWARARPEPENSASGPRYRRGGNWKIQARAARERDHFSCRICGKTEEQLGRKLDVHHAIPYGSFDSNLGANNIEHLIALCPSCHRQAESRLQEELPLLTRASTPSES